ncbi:MAG: CopG family transcriptional regulator [Pseudomonadota bacterium]
MSFQRTTVTLDEEAMNFLIASAKNNKSAYINNLLKQEKRRLLEQKILQSNIEEAGDEDYQEELATWDITSEDGL